MSIRIFTTLATAGCVAFLSACGGGSDKPTLSSAQVSSIETAIAQTILNQKQLKATVTCPAKVEKGKGKTFVCTAKGPQVETTQFDVTQTDNAGHVSYVAR